MGTDEGRDERGTEDGDVTFDPLTTALIEKGLLPKSALTFSLCLKHALDLFEERGLQHGTIGLNRVCFALARYLSGEELSYHLPAAIARREIQMGRAYNAPPTTQQERDDVRALLVKTRLNGSQEFIAKVREQVAAPPHTEVKPQKVKRQRRRFARCEDDPLFRFEVTDGTRRR